MKYTGKLLTPWAIAAATALMTGCATYEPVESSAVSAAISFDDVDRFATEIPDTSTIDTAFSKEVQQLAHNLLVEELEDEGFDYVGETEPQLRMRFSTYVSAADGYIDTTQPVVSRVIEQQGVETVDGSFIPTGSAEIRTTREAKPIYVKGQTRLFMLDVVDSETEVLLWRGYTTSDEIGLDAEAIQAHIERLVDELEEQT